jgi:hypothetical protein
MTRVVNLLKAHLFGTRSCPVSIFEFTRQKIQMSILFPAYLREKGAKQPLTPFGALSIACQSEPDISLEWQCCAGFGTYTASTFDYSCYWAPHTQRSVHDP